MSDHVVVHEGELPAERWDDGRAPHLSWRTLLSADRVPTDSMTAGIAVLQPGPAVSGMHRHAPAEVYHFLAGRGILTVDGADHEVSAGSTAFIPGGAWHDVRNTGDDELRLLYVFAVDSFTDVEYEFADPDPPR
jgi:quercetin dioxygenase-like cupin family protein